MYSYLETDEHYEDSAKKRYEKFLARRIQWQARKPFIAVLVALSIIFGAYVSHSYFPRPCTNERIYEKYFKRYDINSSYNSSYLKAIKNYQLGNSKEAIKLFNEISRNDSLNTTNCFYLALSYTDCYKYKETIRLLEAVAKSKGNVYYHPANWYLALSYLKIQETEKSTYLFKQIVLEDSPYRDEALEIIQLLEKIND